MKVSKTNLIDCLLIEPRVFKDFRGSFFESFSKLRYQQDALINHEFVQDNFSSSRKGVLRGLHFQRKNPQGKLVRVSRGKVYDVAVDIRPRSQTFKKWFGLELSEENKFQLWIPPGFAHGFLVLSEEADFEYKCTSYYDPNDEACIRWDDPEIGIKWPVIEDIIVSEKDNNAPYSKDLTFGHCS